MAAVRFVLFACFSLFFSSTSVATERVSSLSHFCNGNDTVDDTECIRAWLAAAQATGERDLYVPPGTYLYSSTVPLHSNLHIRCAGPGAAVFQNNRDANGPRPGTLFVAPAAVNNVIVENCAFDVRGGTDDFLAVIAANTTAANTNIHIRGNRVYDSARPETHSDKQRQYILLMPCNDCWIENNRLSEGGRIKVGRPGLRLFIRNNVVRHVNDNAITVVDLNAPPNESRQILIDGNVVVEPKGVGIFFGADGQSQGAPGLAAYNVRVSRNVVRGDFGIACIRGVLPAQSRRIHVTENICVKQGSTPAAGIDILRPDGTHPRALDILIGSNTIASGGGVLDPGGIFVRGNHKGFRVIGNSVRDVGFRAIRFEGDVEDAIVADNVFAGGGLVINGSLSGSITNNLLIEPGDLGMHLQALAGRKIAASIRQNTIRQPKAECIRFNGPGVYEVDLVDNSFVSCAGPAAVTFMSGAALAPGFQRRHNKGDVAPHATPTRHLTATAGWATVIASGASDGTSVAVPGAARGNIAGATFDGLPAANFQLSAYVTGAGTVRVVLTNHSGANATLKGTLRVDVWSFD